MQCIESLLKIILIGSLEEKMISGYESYLLTDDMQGRDWKEELGWLYPCWCNQMVFREHLGKPTLGNNEGTKLLMYVCGEGCIKTHLMKTNIITPTEHHFLLYFLFPMSPPLSLFTLKYCSFTDSVYLCINVPLSLECMLLNVWLVFVQSNLLFKVCECITCVCLTHIS